MASFEKRQEIRRQVEGINELHQRLVQACFEKCVPPAKDQDLSIGEMTCLDRCVPKYLEAHEVVGKEIQTIKNALVAPSKPAGTPTAPS